STTAMLVAVGSAVALANLVMTVLVLALGRAGSVASSWVIGSFVGALVLAVPGVAPLRLTCLAFVAAQVVALGVLALEEARGRARMDASPPDGRPAVPPGR
ncbi:MAG: hypothetical protein H0T17_08285, partial [Propionibacteriales bacterium]|nr:hypothetical protein [Propionibacteriales bacterium]